MFSLSSEILFGTTIKHFNPLRAATTATLIPVLPELASTIIVSLLYLFRFQASITKASAILSLIEPNGLKYSNLE